MAMTNAERQRKHRERHLSSEIATASRINTLVSDHAKLALERLAACYCVTNREMLERVILAEQGRVLAGLSGDDQCRYYDKALRRNDEPPPAPPVVEHLEADPPPAKDYPGEVKSKAVRMHQAGRSRDEIRAWLVSQVGKAPAPSNWTKTLRRWAADGRHDQDDEVSE